jgi:hypothetical protein
MIGMTLAQVVPGWAAARAWTIGEPGQDGARI